MRNMLNPRLVPIRRIQLASRLEGAVKTGGGKVTPKMANLQKKFQENNGKPVFLKGGAMDNILYRLTLVLCVLGVVGDVWLWFGYILA
ncbi:uncharacterized protein Dwil_GK13185 [Drosophila willistoni]|uniref:Uncharacterized protein n=2 Tax=Drosophila willistoni TaxID=7260 RepID=B4NLG5_DROWI|nr:uncharacterized protein Dwil_GK13185 [Drosophila willistoni]